MQKKGIIRTPEDRFKNLSGFPYEPHYLEIDGVRIHYVDEGKGEVILCLHGEPSWSYLYRKFIPVLTPAYRLVAPDLIGFGRSDKYTDIEAYSYGMHFEMLQAFIQQLNLENITLVMQDWGGILGLGLVGKMPEKFSRLVILNTGLPTGDRPLPKAFKAWRAFAKNIPGLPVGRIMKMGTYQPLSKEVLAAYKAPFPSKAYKAGAKIFPQLVPEHPEDGGVPELKRAKEVLSNWQKPALVMFSDKDPIMGRGDRFFRKLIPSAKAEPEILICDAGHFLQEDKGQEIAGHIRDFMERRR